MKFKELKRKEDFMNLKKGDDLLIHWNSEAEIWDKDMEGYKIYKILYKQFANNHSKYEDEIILRKKGNIFFNCRMFLNGHSKIVKEVYLLEDKA